MCGIVAAAAGRSIVPARLEGLHELAYCGHESVGLAVTHGGLHRLRSSGRLIDFEALAKGEQVRGVAVVHRGITENSVTVE